MRCSVYIAMSLDGFIARPDGGLDFLKRFETSGEDYGYNAFAATIDTMVIGRGTYDTVLGMGVWPYEGKRCVVLTHRAVQGDHGEEGFSGGVAELVAKLEREGVKRAYVDGGNVIQQFLAAGRIDDLTISVIPTVLGDGIRLFGAGGPGQALELEQVRSWPSGLAQLRYRASR